MISPVTFLFQTQDELKKVTWPKQQEVIRLTAVVIIVSIIVGLYIGGIDYILTQITSYLIK
jgi:preprotein translocase subunit SecE